MHSKKQKEQQSIPLSDKTLTHTSSLRKKELWGRIQNSLSLLHHCFAQFVLIEPATLSTNLPYSKKTNKTEKLQHLQLPKPDKTVKMSATEMEKLQKKSPKKGTRRIERKTLSEEETTKINQEEISSQSKKKKKAKQKLEELEEEHTARVPLNNLENRIQNELEVEKSDASVQSLLEKKHSTDLPFKKIQSQLLQQLKEIKEESEEENEPFDALKEDIDTEKILNLAEKISEEETAQISYEILLKRIKEQERLLANEENTTKIPFDALKKRLGDSALKNLAGTSEDSEPTEAIPFEELQKRLRMETNALLENTEEVLAALSESSESTTALSFEQLERRLKEERTVSGKFLSELTQKFTFLKEEFIGLGNFFSIEKELRFSVNGLFHSQKETLLTVICNNLNFLYETSTVLSQVEKEETARCEVEEKNNPLTSRQKKVLASLAQSEKSVKPSSAEKNTFAELVVPFQSLLEESQKNQLLLMQRTDYLIRKIHKIISDCEEKESTQDLMKLLKEILVLIHSFLFTLFSVEFGSLDTTKE